jgi:hypothetical protein
MKKALSLRTVEEKRLGLPRNQGCLIKTTSNGEAITPTVDCQKLESLALHTLVRIRL